MLCTRAILCITAKHCAATTRSYYFVAVETQRPVFADSTRVFSLVERPETLGGILN